jgi:hypothetical protein
MTWMLYLNLDSYKYTPQINWSCVKRVNCIINSLLVFSLVLFEHRNESVAWVNANINEQTPQFWQSDGNRQPDTRDIHYINGECPLFFSFLTARNQIKFVSIILRNIRRGENIIHSLTCGNPVFFFSHWLNFFIAKLMANYQIKIDKLKNRELKWRK